MSNISISIVLHNTYKGELNEVISSCVNSSIPVDIFLIDNSPNDKLSCFKEDARVTYLKSDNKKKVGKKYGVSRFLFPSRKTFLIDENGILIHIIDEVNLNTHPMDIIKIFEQAEIGLKS